MKRRAAVEPSTRHLKTKQSLNRNQLWAKTEYPQPHPECRRNELPQAPQASGQFWLSVLRGLERLRGQEPALQIPTSLTRIIPHTSYLINRFFQDRLFSSAGTNAQEGSRKTAFKLAWTAKAAGKKRSCRSNPRLRARDTVAPC